MGKTMPKTSVIYGEQHMLPVANFTGSHMTAILDLVAQKVGPNVVVDRAAITKAVTAAKNHKKMKDAYLKIGVIDGNLVLRCKEKRFFGDIEVDAVLVKSYPTKVKAYAIEKLKNEMDEIERQAAVKQEQERLAQEQKARPIPLAPEKPKEPTPEEIELARQERLRKVMNTPDKSGETMREKMLRAAEKGKKLGVGKGTQERLASQGLHPMDERYHGEVVDHQKNRYGRHLAPLKDVWDKEKAVGMNFSQWLDEVEKGNTSVPGVAKARTLKNSDTGGLIVEEGGTAGGTMVYLDDETRKPYEARVSRGTIAGTQVTGSGEFIFVIGPDNKVYAGKKARAKAGERTAFNHSSFFAGGPVKSAGTIKVSGGKITELSDLSGHYTPKPAMVVTAIRKLGTHDPTWLSEVRIKVSNKDAGSGTEYLTGEAQTRLTETWGKRSHGQKTGPWAENVLMNGEDGSWLLRHNRTNLLTISYRKADVVTHVPIAELGSLGLDRPKLIEPGKLPAQRAPTNPQPVQPKPTQPEPPKTTAPTGEKPKGPTLQAELVADLVKSPAYHAGLDRVGSVELLTGKPENAWLLRDSSDKELVFSRIEKGKIAHALVTTAELYEAVAQHMRRHTRLQIAK